jgi:hypothetical protein
MASVWHSLAWAGWRAHAQGDHEHASTLLEQGLALLRQVGDRRGIALSLQSLGRAAQARGDNARETELFRESMLVERSIA